jgi:hypothetical protein
VPKPDGLVPGNAKVIAAWTALVVALSGAIEARLTLGNIEARVDRIERIVENAERTATR